jgi:hypothetical protein
MVFILVDQQVTEVDKAQANFKLAIVRQKTIIFFSQDKKMMKKPMRSYGTLKNFQSTLYMFRGTLIQFAVRRLK